MHNKFDNANVKSWYLWLFLRKSKNEAVAIYFLSRRYGTSPRFFPLYNNFRKTDIVLFRGSRFQGLDRVYLKLLPYFIRLFQSRLALYKNFIALNSDSKLVIPTNMILNLDDPSYDAQELASIKDWEIAIKNRGFISSIVCTTQHMQDYLQSNGVTSSIHVIPQGHGNLDSSIVPRSFLSGNNLNFVYISPTIDIKGDPHEGHNMWDASTLLLDIWPKVTASNARLHLIGQLGHNATKCLSDNRIISYGLISIKECTALLPNFDVALYPRNHDNRWLPQKLVEYIGAGLPIVAFEMIDTKIVSELNVGLLVKNSEEFAQTLKKICSGLVPIDELRRNSVRAAPDYSWSSLALKFESIFQ